jgi:hypothetical protein
VGQSWASISSAAETNRLGCPTAVLDAGVEKTVCEYGTLDATTKANAW